MVIGFLTTERGPGMTGDILRGQRDGYMTNVQQQVARWYTLCKILRDRFRARCVIPFGSVVDTGRGTRLFDLIWQWKGFHRSSSSCPGSVA
jgi:hypothetical protein